MRVPIVIERASSVPLHRQIYERWRHGILAGRFRRGDKVPSTRELADALAVSRATVTNAYEQLLAEGYFEAKRGSGTFISRELQDSAISRAGVSAGRTPAVSLSCYGARLDRDDLPRSAAPGEINLSAFGPDLGHFPFALWRRLLTRHLRHIKPELFGRIQHSAGHPALRDEIASYLARSRAVRCDPEQVIVVNGSQQALDLCMRLLLDVGDKIALEDPGYLGTRQLAIAHGACVCPVSVAADGIRVRDLPDAARLVYVTPSHQFPVGVSMSLGCRLALLDWARTRGAVIIEDDYDSEYRYSGSPLPALQGLTDGAAVIYLGTFSNVMFPALRIGYLVVPRQLVTPFVRAKWLADRCTTLLEQAALADFIREGHLERHIRRTRRVYKRRRDVLVESLVRHIGDVTIHGDPAGMHALVSFGHGGIRARAQRNGVRIASASSYYVSGKSTNDYILGFSAIPESTIREGVERLMR